MSTRARYQFGGLTRRKRFRGGDVWQFRFSETTMEDRRCLRSRLIGTCARYPTRADISRLSSASDCESILTPVRHTGLLDAVVDHYIERELPILRYGTQQSHLSTLNRWILPHWGSYLLEQVKPVDVGKSGEVLFPWRPNVRSTFEACFTLSMCMPDAGNSRDSNPIDLVRQSAGRKTIPRTLSTRDIGLLLPNLRSRIVRWFWWRPVSGCGLVKSSGSSGATLNGRT